VPIVLAKPTTSLKSSFGLVAAEDSRVLILGSLPGERSLQQQEYYAHPQNAFWRLMEAVTGATLVGTAYPERLAALLAAGVALWDVIQSAERVGSLDAAIRNHTGNDLVEAISNLPSLRTVAFNGLRASAIGRKRLGSGDRPALLTLPSSSPAYTMPFEQKRARWLVLRDHLDVNRASAKEY
jgi:TDG/mug DNA glycosylase family protein